jgi:thymidylate kinase
MEAVMHATNGSIRGRDIELVSIKDILVKYPDLHQALTSRKTFDFNDVQILQMVASHIELITTSIARSITNNSIVILDRSIPSYFVYQSLGNMADISTLLYRNILKPYESHLCCIYLAPGIDVIKQRLSIRADANHLVDKIPDIYERYEHYFSNEYSGLVKTIRYTNINSITDRVILFLRSNCNALS